MKFFKFLATSSNKGMYNKTIKQRKIKLILSNKIYSDVENSTLLLLCHNSTVIKLNNSVVLKYNTIVSVKTTEKQPFI